MQLRVVAPIAALVAVLVMVAPAWAGTVQIQDDAHVLDATVVQNDAATLPVGVYIWATTQDADSKSVFDTDVRNKVNTTFPIVIGINTQSHHESIQVGSQAGLSQRAALAAESSANGAFLSTIHSSHDYTTAVTAALGNLRHGFAVAHRGGALVQRVPAQPAGFGVGLLLFIVLIVGVIAVVVIMARRRRRSGFGAGSSTVVGQPPMGTYPDYGPSYGGPSYGGPSYGGPGYRSGMGAGTAGAIGAVGGGLLGYELGKMHGEEQQFRRDEMMYDQDRGVPSEGGDQGDWVVGQDSDFGDAGDGDQQGSGDW
ncbi:MAG: hypothetical protein WCF33_21035 [Pseudonocardiaceae bacterium]